MSKQIEIPGVMSDDATERAQEYHKLVRKANEVIRALEADVILAQQLGLRAADYARKNEAILRVKLDEARLGQACAEAQMEVLRDLVETAIRE